jgi:hypothetical protein
LIWCSIDLEQHQLLAMGPGHALLLSFLVLYTHTLHTLAFPFFFYFPPFCIIQSVSFLLLSLTLFLFTWCSIASSSFPFQLRSAPTIFNSLESLSRFLPVDGWLFQRLRPPSYSRCASRCIRSLLFFFQCIAFTM